MKSLNEAMKNLQKSKIIKENNLKSKKSLKTESKDPTYIVCSYYDEKLHGLEDELKTDDWSEVEDFAHRKLMQGNMLEIENTKTGKYRRINPDEYDETFDGEFIVRPEELEEAKENNLKSKKSLKTESKFDKSQAVLSLDNYHSMGIIVSDDGSTVQYMYSNDENSIYESEIEYDEEGNPYFKDENDNTWYLNEFMRTDYPKTVKEMKQDVKTKSNEHAIVIKTGLSDSKAEDILNSVIGQMSDGIWENSPRMDRYWKYADIIKEGSEIAIKISNPDYYENGFKGKSESEIKKFFAQKVKQIVKKEELNWDRNNEERTRYLDRHSGVTVKDAYRVYDKLLGRRERITEANQDEYNYMLLDRLKQDCEYFLGNGNRSEKHLWAGNVNDQIAKMKELYNKLPEKPEWLSMEDIENYEKEMKQDEKTELNESLEMDEAIKTGVLNYLDEYNTENLMDYGSDEDAIGGMNSISKMFEDILRDILKINFVNVSTVDGISDGKYVTTIDFGDKTLDLDIRASEEKDDILEDVKTIIDFYNKNIENLTEDVGTMTSDEYNYMLLDRLKQDCEYYLGNGNRNAKYLWAGNEDGQIAEMRKIYNQLKEKPEWLTIDDINNYAKEMGVVELPSTTDGTAAKTIEDTLDRNRNRINEEISTPDEYILNEVKKALIERGIDIDLMHETCSELNLTSLMRKIIHYVLSGINFSINEYVYGEDFDVTLDNKLNLSIDIFEDLDEDKEVNKSTITITPAERKILNAVKTVNSKYDLSNIKLETTPDGATHIMSTKGEDIVTIKPLSDDEKEDLRLNGYYINN